MKAARLYGLLGVCILGGALLLLMVPRAKEVQALREENAQLESSERVIAALQQISILSLVWDNVTLDQAMTVLLREIGMRSSNAADISLTWSGANISDICANLSDVNVFDALRYVCEIGCICTAACGTSLVKLPQTYSVDDPTEIRAQTFVPPADMTNDPTMMVKKVIVCTLDMALPAGTCQWENILWNTFANQPAEMQFNQMTAKQWQSNWVSFAVALCKKARIQHLPFDALERCLITVRSKSHRGVASLPVGAYFVQANQRPVWIIVCKWECEDEDATLSHICIWALDADTGTTLSFITCM